MQVRIIISVIIGTATAFGLKLYHYSHFGKSITPGDILPLLVAAFGVAVIVFAVWSVIVLSKPKTNVAEGTAAVGEAWRGGKRYTQGGRAGFGHAGIYEPEDDVHNS